MAKYAVLTDNVVTNIVVSDSKLQPNWVEINDGDDIRIGYIQNQPGGVIQAPSIPITDRRKKMVLSRPKFAFAVAKAEIITNEEAKAWAGGKEIPAPVQTAINTAYPNLGEDRLEAEIEILTAKNVNRSHPLLLLLQQQMGISDEVADSLFE